MSISCLSLSLTFAFSSSRVPLAVALSLSCLPLISFSVRSQKSRASLAAQCHLSHCCCSFCVPCVSSHTASWGVWRVVWLCWLGVYCCVQHHVLRWYTYTSLSSLAVLSYVTHVLHDGADPFLSHTPHSGTDPFLSTLSFPAAHLLLVFPVSLSFCLYFSLTRSFSMFAGRPLSKAGA